jgi:glucosamine--fructose-6-phosphate aminotransferase (isomerizing)
MCGITAYLGKRKACQVVLEGLTILQNRGYDSAGIATTNENNQIITTKSASQQTTCDSLKYLTDSLYLHENNTIGIGHTRWATHGPKTDTNAHPHSDLTKRFSIVHNGVIENHNAIRKFLSENNIECISDTDTEVIVQLISYYSMTGLGFEESVKSAIGKLEGTWGVVILDNQHSDTLIVARHGSPILLGVGQDEVFVGSEVSAFQKYTTQYISLNSNEIAILKYNKDGEKGKRIEMVLSDSVGKDRIKSAEIEEIRMYPDPYPHWTIREINEQPDAILLALNNGGRIINDSEVALGGLDRNKERLLKIKNLVIVGCGTSRHAGLFISGIMRTLCGFNSVQVIDASEFDMTYINTTEDVGILALSQSGETKDVMRCLEMVNNYEDASTFSVVNSVGSQIARTTNCGVYLNAGREVAVASTKAFTSQITVLSLISIWYAQNRKLHHKKRLELVENLRRLSMCYQTALLSDNIDNECNKVAEYLKDRNTCFILGKGLSSFIAFEGALKIKEIGYIHAEGYPGGALKHGPFALIENGTPIILIVLNDIDRSYMESTISEVQSRGAYTIVITDIPEFDDGDINIYIPNNGTLTAMLAVVPLQLIAYKLSISKGINPDKPRNLAKTVTVI